MDSGGCGYLDARSMSLAGVAVLLFQAGTDFLARIMFLLLYQLFRHYGIWTMEVVYPGRWR